MRELRRRWIGAALLTLPLLWAGVGARAGIVVKDSGSAASAAPEVAPSTPEEDRAALEALSLYPEETRRAALEASLHFRLIQRIGEIQTRSSAAFGKRIARAAPEEQVDLWELTRFPGLVEGLVAAGPQSDEEISALLEAYPEEIRGLALEYAREHFELLAAIYAIRLQAETEFDALLEGYPLETQATFRTLVEQPDLLGLLTANQELMRTLGDIYRRDPAATLAELARIGDWAARRNEQAFASWREGVGDAAGEDEVPAGWSPVDTYEWPSAETGSAAAASSVAVHSYSARATYTNVYPYWFGSPSWVHPSAPRVRTIVVPVATPVAHPLPMAPSLDERVLQRDGRGDQRIRLDRVLRPGKRDPSQRARRLRDDGSRVFQDHTAQRRAETWRDRIADRDRSDSRKFRRSVERGARSNGADLFRHSRGSDRPDSLRGQRDTSRGRSDAKGSRRSAPKKRSPRKEHR